MKNSVNLDTLLRDTSAEVIDKAIRFKPTRNFLTRQGEKRLYHKFVEVNRDRVPQKVQEMRCRVMENLLASINRAIEEGRLSDHVRKKAIKTFVGNVLTGETDRMAPFREKHGFNPPSLLTISPTKRCNLRCKGCYAASSSAHANTMDYETLTRLLWDKHNEWGSNFTVISGGEPLMYKSGEKDIFDIFHEHAHNYFLMYTNATLINDEVARKLAEAGNVTPAISVEGWEKETDARRGKGVFKRILQAMENLRNHGVPFGISVTATRENAETILSDEFMDYFFDTQGAIYGWIFQYMPIGRSYTVDLMVTPEQREWMLEKEMDLIYSQDRFLVDFWNGGPLSLGCISAGKPGGYFYVDWDGNIAPCVFFPYGIDNLYDIYERGETISAPLFTDYFKQLREWQDTYVGRYSDKPTHNLFLPCPIKDHHSFAEQVIQQNDVWPMDESAAKALHDKEYHRRMRAHDEELKKRLDPLWEEKMVKSG
ncbi:MAG: radical SAM/SPASM domain-containing protein [Spirochaetaceae bacterium]